MAREAEWFEVASADNAASAATRAAAVGIRHSVTFIMASFGAAATKLLTITVAGKTLEFYVANNTLLQFDPPLRCNSNEAAVASLAASGTGGVLGKVTMGGYSS